MSKHVVSAAHEASHGTLKSYTFGFIYSVVLTVIAFGLVGGGVLHGSVAVATIIGLALVQLYVQVVYFLHLGRDASQRWNVLVFVFMLNVVLILVIGSLWIMQNMNYHHENRSPSQITNDIEKDEGYK